MSAAIAARFEREKRGALLARQLERRGEQRLHLRSNSMALTGVAPASYAASSRRSQARAMAHSRLTEASEMPATLAVSSSVRPPK